MRDDRQDTLPERLDARAKDDDLRPALAFAENRPARDRTPSSRSDAGELARIDEPDDLARVCVEDNGRPRQAAGCNLSRRRRARDRDDLARRRQAG